MTGLEGDYDGGEVGIDEAARRLLFAGVTALLYTSPSHRPEAPRWRVLAPFSRDYMPRERRQFMARLNGALGGVLAPESFALAQTYYVGRVTGAVYESRRVEGQYIDLLDELDAIAIDSGRQNGESRRERLSKIESTDPVVQRLTELGLAQRIGGDGKVDITCPFAAEHTTDGGAGDTVYFPAHTGGYALGHFKCLHAHCAERRDGDFLGAIGLGLARNGEANSSLVLLSGCDIRPEPIRWIWDGWLAQGKLHILAGAAGTGKTTIALALAATVTTGGRWPDGSHESAGSVLIASFEDDPTDTLTPRLLAMGADMARVSFLSGVREGDKLRSLHAGDHASLLAETIREHDVRLVVVDPIISALGVFDSHRNAETRAALQPFVHAVAGTKAALLGIAHFTKGTAGREPLERVSGSLAFGALARVVLGAAKVKSEDGAERRLFLRIKSNIGPDAGGYEYALQQNELPEHRGVLASRVLWGDAVDGSARELLAEADGADDGGGGALEGAKKFLESLLANGPVATKLIKADADGAGYSWATIRRARSTLGVEAVKEGGCFGGGKQQWLWKLPDTEGAQESQKVPNKRARASSEDVEHLQAGDPGTGSPDDYIEVTV